MSFKILGLILIFSSTILFAQTNISDLFQKNFDELLDLYNQEESFNKREKYVNFWLDKAKKEKNIKKLLTGYEIASTLYINEEKCLKYLDSILLYSLKDSKYDGYSSSAYRMKGEYFYKKRKFKKELKNYLFAKKYADRAKIPIMSFFIEYNIALIKDRNGEHEEALEMHKKNFLYAKNEMRERFKYSYIQTIYALGNSYNYLNRLDSALFYNKLGYRESSNLNLSDEKYFFILNQGITHYFNREYDSALDSLLKASTFFGRVNDLPNSSEAYFYLAKSYEKVGKEKLSIKHFQKVDTIFRKTNDLLPVLRETYHKLINYSEKQDDLRSQIDYTNQLIELDSILYTNEIFVNKNLIKEFDIPRLVSNKEKLIKELQKKSKKSKIYVALLIIIITIFIGISYHQFYRRKFYKKRFDEIILNKDIKKDNNDKDIIDVTATVEINIPKEIVSEILSKIEDFETNENFTAKKITLSSLAKEFNTNTNYLSKVINFYKKTSFSNYLNSLRINYIIEKLKTDLNLRKFTIKAIAEEAGFNNSESFSKSFFKAKGIKPSYFLRELDKIKDNN